MDELRFDGKVVIVTGAGRGIGRQHALLFGSKGARVVVADLGGDVDGSGFSDGPATAVTHEIAALGGEAVACHASVAEEPGAASIVRTALDSFGRLDAVVNNAGISDPTPLAELTMEQFRRMLDVHFFGSLFVIRSAWPHFVEAGYGRVVNTVSESMLGGIPNQTHYACAKGAVLALTRCLATEGESHGIRVNAIAPRAFTRMSLGNTFKNSPPEVIEEAKTMLAPELNSPAAVFLAHESCPLNGEVLRAGMGSVARLAVIHTKGMSGDLSVEDIATNLDTILDVTDARITGIHPTA